MSTGKSETDIQADLCAKVDAMPPALTARYVPLIKAYERMVLRFHTELASIAVFGDADIEALENDFALQNPRPADAQELEVWQAELQTYVEMVLDTRYPGARQKILELSEDFGQQLQELAQPFSLENFKADGGTQEQLNDLHQAVLSGVFSRPRGLEGPTPVLGAFSP